MRGLGYLDDDLDTRDQNYAMERLLYKPDVPRSYDLTRYVDHVRDQGSTSACVGFALTRACHMRAQIQGIGSEHGSPFYAYAIGRANAFDTPTALMDSGSQPRNVIKAVKDWGLVGEHRWAWDDAKNVYDVSRVNELPNWQTLEGGESMVSYNPVGYYWINSTGDEKLLALKRALSSGFPVSFAVDVEPEFVSWADDKPIPDLDEDAPIVGSHMLTAVGYTNEDDVVFVNSWSSTWGDFGFGVLSKSRFLNPSTRALVAIEVAPKVE